MISVICAIMNREEMLKISLPSWLNFKEVTEVIIVDWSSNTDLSWVTYDKRVKYVRVFGEDYFSIANAYNIGFKLATQEYILKLDVDIVLNPYYNFFDKYLPAKDTVVRGNWDIQETFKHHFKSFLVGTHLIERKHLQMFDSGLVGYGQDDTELYKRYIDAGLAVRHYEDDYTIFHMPHPNEKRTENYVQKNHGLNAIMNKRIIDRLQRTGGKLPQKTYNIKQIGDIYVAREA